MNGRIIRMAFASCLSASALAMDEIEEYGGELVRWPKDPGVFYVVNAQKDVDVSALAGIVDDLQQTFAIDIRKTDGAVPDLKDVPAALRKMDAKGAIWVVDDPALPAVLSASEDGWGILNVAALNADGASKAKVDARLTKQTRRLFGYIHGAAGVSIVPGCVFQPAIGVAGLDDLVCADISPESRVKIQRYLKLRGYKTCQSGTYYDACENGWAPAPTNDIQRAIWNKVHAMPTNPIRINPGDKPQPKKDK